MLPAQKQILEQKSISQASDILIYLCLMTWPIPIETYVSLLEAVRFFTIDT